MFSVAGAAAGAGRWAAAVAFDLVSRPSGLSCRRMVMPLRSDAPVSSMIVSPFPVHAVTGQSISAENCIIGQSGFPADLPETVSASAVGACVDLLEAILSKPDRLSEVLHARLAWHAWWRAVLALTEPPPLQAVHAQRIRHA